MTSMSYAHASAAEPNDMPMDWRYLFLRYADMNAIAADWSLEDDEREQLLRAVMDAREAGGTAAAA